MAGWRHHDEMNHYPYDGFHNPPRWWEPPPRPGHPPHGEHIDRFKETGEWHPRHRIEYSPHGDNIDRFALKVSAELEMIYHLLNRLRKLDASAGQLADTVAYQLHVDTASGRILMRDAQNQNWIELGKLGKNFFGLEPEDIGAVRNTGSIGAFNSGDAANRPQTANMHDIFYALDEKKIYYYSGTAWELLASLDFNDLYGSESTVIAQDEVGYSGAGKILRLDEDGKANVDITGSPDKLLGYPIEVTNLQDGDVLIFDAAQGKIVNVPKDTVTDDDISDTGEAGKLVRLDSDGVIHADLDGKLATARKIALTGDADGEAYFDGSEDVAINVSVTKPVAQATNAVTAEMATTDSEGNVISQTYATKDEISDFVTTHEFASTLEDYAPASAVSYKELIFREDIAVLFDEDGSTLKENMPSIWDNVALATDEDIESLFSEEA